MSKSKRTDSCAITIFGAKGDLTKRKLIPALYNLYADNHLPANFAIFCVDFVTMDEQAYRNEMLEGIDEFSRNGKADRDKWAIFAARIFYIQGDFQQSGIFDTLRDKIKAFEQQKRSSRMFYFAVAPRFIEIIADALCVAKVCTDDTHHRIVVSRSRLATISTLRKN